MLWAFKAAASWLFLWDRVPRRRAGQDHGNATISAYFCSQPSAAAITPSLKQSSSPLCDNPGTTAVVHQALGFVTATDGACVSVRVCHVSRCPRTNRNEDMISRAGQLIGCCCAGGQNDIHPHFLETSKASALTRYTPQRQQRYNSSATAPALKALAFVTATVRLCSRVCSR